MKASTSSILRGILITSRSLTGHLRDIGFRPKTHSQPSETASPVALSLPYPNDIVESIRSSVISAPVQDRVVDRVDKWYQETLRTLQIEYTSTLSKLAPLPPIPGINPEQNLPSVYESLFKDKLVPKFRADIDSLLRQALANHHAARQNEKRKLPFNHECLPLLETYFEYNAYPSAQDRALLARKTMMCSRQIEVWFQNHRRRAKKEGRQLRRLSQDPLPRELDIEHLNTTVSQVLAPKDELKANSLKESSPNDVILQPPTPAVLAADALCAQAPAHAFPTKYPPTPDHTAGLLSGKSWSFPTPVWPRQSSVKAPLRKPIITPNELAVELQLKLSITGSDTAKRPHAASPAWYPIMTVPLAAPHFALVRTPSSPSFPQPQPIVRDPPTPQFLRQKTSSLTNYKRPSPYQLRQPLKHRSLGRTASNSSLCSLSSSSDESEIQTPSPSPLARYLSLPKEAYIPPQYPDWEAYLLPP
ncbi:homeodomain mating-type protein [Coprinellus micaceus]|uniref:Homeodomain mating-type protein n=1 Tax=Coprinellus micaceus TaxID=71717 RepID=A0A4Y7TYJ8_COPMI|nr:homeodomain mating-type protein [Coprinellus micaceus]